MLGLVATMDFGWRSGCLYSREGFDDRVLVGCSCRHHPRISCFWVQGLAFQIELCTPRDYIPYRLVVPRCWAFELPTGLIDPKAHGDALAGNKIFMAHFSSRR